MIDFKELKPLGLKLAQRSRELQAIDERLNQAAMEAARAIESHSLRKAGWHCYKQGWVDPKHGGFHSRSEAYKLLQLRLKRAKGQA